MKLKLKRTASCIRCRMYLDICLCPTLPQIEISTRVVIFMHQKEHGLLTNTGMLAHRVLKNSAVVFRGNKDKSFVAPDTFSKQASAHNTFILYPSDTAEEIGNDFAARHPGPLTLICPDGHWGQARKIVSKEPSLDKFRCVKLPEGQKSSYRLRRNITDGRVCTFEAISRALGLIEGAEIRETMEKFFERMVTRLLWTRGKIQREEVVW